MGDVREQELTMETRMKLLCSLALCGMALPLVGSPLGAAASARVSDCRPRWEIGDWWTVESQRYDRGENLPGASPGWLEKESWKFSVEGTNAVGGEFCYRVSVRGQGGNQCPYWFVYWFRMSDLVVLRRQLYQPAGGKSLQAATAPMVEVNYAPEEAMPFVPPDFPNLPMTTPRFGDSVTNEYSGASERALGKAARTFAPKLTQDFHPGEKLSFAGPAGTKRVGPGTRGGVVVIGRGENKFERQSWDGEHPWHVYAEEWEFGDPVRRSWLADYGHTTPGAGGSKNGGGK